MTRMPLAMLLLTCSAMSAPARAQDVTLKDAIQCKELKHNSDGSWYADSVSVNYGPGGKQQLNLFDTTIRKGSTEVAGLDVWQLLNEKCGAGH
jgi:hypothetical protein